MSQHLQDQRIKTLYVARQASCCAEPVTQEGKNLSLKAQLLRTLLHCWTVYLPDLILLSDFYVDNLKKSDSSCFCHVNRIRIGILTWGCAERIYTRDLHETHSPTKFSLFPESVLLFRYTVANARRDVTSGNHRKWPERENWEKVSKKQAITKTQVNVL